MTHTNDEEEYLTQHWLFNRGGTMPTIPNNLHKQTLTEFLMEIYKENERLKAEMTELEEKFLTLNGKSYSYYFTLQEIKAIAEQILNNNEFVYQNHRDIRQIIRLITKAEEE